jgi:hypothetical protein
VATAPPPAAAPPGPQERAINTSIIVSISAENGVAKPLAQVGHLTALSTSLRSAALRPHLTVMTDRSAENGVATPFRGPQPAGGRGVSIKAAYRHMRGRPGLSGGRALPGPDAPSPS